jgi:hypothetical protein
MVELVVESITPLTIEALRNFRLSSACWLPSPGPS